MVVARLTLHVHYVTRWGEHLWLERRVPGTRDGADATTCQPMQHVGGGVWNTDVDVPGAPGAVEYRYVCRVDGGVARREPAYRAVEVLGNSQAVVDQWFAPEFGDAAFLRQAFAGVIFRTVHGRARTGPAERSRLRVTIRAARVHAGYRLCLTGNHPLLGHWDPARALVMSGTRYPLWVADLPLAEMAPPLEFKFGLWEERSARLVVFEVGPNRVWGGPDGGFDAVVVNQEHFRYAEPWRGAGVAIPVFSLRSERGYGIGEFADLEGLAAWAAGCGMHLVQVLPINDTSADFTRRDSYPYRAISTAALHPIYLNVQTLFEHYQRPLPPGFFSRRTRLNQEAEVDYEGVIRDKLDYLRQLYAAVGSQECRTREFQSFWRKQRVWLRPYAAFCRLRDRHRTADFSQWGKDAVYSENRVKAWFRPQAPEYAEVMLHCFVQYHLKAQLDRALAVGHALGVAFKGDLPIGINRCSVEAWTEPGLFRMDRQTGAPPDSFSALGQNWGFPTYHWPRLEAAGYAWWRQRLQRMAVCFDALRIDHILGFFRIWEIPGDCHEGILGHFNPALPLSRQEIKAAGFDRDPAAFAVPSVGAHDLADFFGADADALAAQVLDRDPDGFFRLRPEFQQPKTRAAWLAARGAGTDPARLAAGLERLTYEVLFLRDPDQPDLFHPRIALRETGVFRALEARAQAALRELHDDFFYRRHRGFWEAEAMKKLPALLEASRMLICGEDLGMVPDCVPAVLKRLGILSLEVHSLPKRPGQGLGNPSEYPYLSVATTSTHDTPTLRGAWEESPEARQAFYREVMGRLGAAPRECPPELCELIVRQNLAGNSMWCILPLQDWLALDARRRRPKAAEERINVPANRDQYWRYRLHVRLEDLLTASDLTERLSRLIAETGRRPSL
jgi:4-alpha-glucanotransferase